MNKKIADIQNAIAELKDKDLEILLSDARDALKLIRAIEPDVLKEERFITLLTEIAGNPAKTTRTQSATTTTRIKKITARIAEVLPATGLPENEIVKLFPNEVDKVKQALQKQRTSPGEKASFKFENGKFFPKA